MGLFMATSQLIESELNTRPEAVERHYFWQVRFTRKLGVGVV
jgi:hypothetical protein